MLRIKHAAGMIRVRAASEWTGEQLLEAVAGELQKTVSPEDNHLLRAPP